jgi:hypothetical protein
MPVNILFIDLSGCDDGKGYVREKLSVAFKGLPKVDLDKLVDNAHRRGRPVSLPLAKKKDFPRLTEKQQRAVARKTKLFIAAVDRLSPLLKGERKQKDDFCTYLIEGFRDYPSGTPALVRKTNYATICYIFEDVLVDPETADVTYQMPRVLGTAGVPEMDQHIEVWMSANIPSAAMPKPEKILEQLAKGLVGLLPGAYGKIGVTLLNILIPSGGGLNYNQLLDNVSTIIADANRRQTISTQGGILNGVVSYINGNYIPQRDAKRSSKGELFNLLNPQLADIYKVIGVLKQEEFEKGGISTFISAVTHKYLIYQEMAVQDPDVTNPKDSSKATSIRHDAKEDAMHVLSVLDKLQKEFDDYLNDWINHISRVRIRITDCPKNEYYFHDSHSNYRSPYFEQSGCKDDPRARAEKARNSYISSVRKQYSEKHQDQLPWMRDVAHSWEKLIDKPLPSEQESGSPI